jgi:putative PIN family toxin of toxin-antitoxin system
LRVLTYPKFHLEEEEVQILLAAYLPWTVAVAKRSHRPLKLPRCRDAEDQKFLELAHAGKAEALVTGDKSLLELADRVPFPIITAAQLRARIG